MLLICPVTFSQDQMRQLEYWLHQGQNLDHLRLAQEHARVVEVDQEAEVEVSLVIEAEAAHPLLDRGECVVDLQQRNPLVF